MSESVECDVVVVGAGFAGVTAGRELSRAGLDVVVLEARERVGGRTWTHDSVLGHPIELGGAFVHWQQPHVWSELVSHGLELEPVAGLEEAYWMGPDGVRSGPPEATYALMAPVMSALADGARESFPRPHTPYPLTEAALKADQVSIGDFLAGLDLTEEQLLFARSYLGIAFSGVPEEGSLSQMQRLIALSAGDWGLFLETASGFTIKTGTRSLIEAMHAQSGARTEFGAVVSKVESGDSGAVVSTADGRAFEAKEVIVTVPLDILTSSIEFVPALSAVKVAASEEGQVSKGLKVWMRATGKVKPFIAFAPLPHPLHMVGYEYDVEGDTILLGFGSDASSLDVTDVRAVEAAVRVFLPEIELTAVDAQDWTNDPFAGETWAMFGPGQMSTFGEEFQRPDGRVRIAGGDYALGWAGHMDGAIESGKRAAQAVVQSISATT